MKITVETKSMRRVRGPVVRGNICTEDVQITDFARKTWRLFGFPIWSRESDHRTVPVHEFIADCLGTRG